jgi:hypothetical protein
MHKSGSSSLGWNGGRKIPARSVRYEFIVLSFVLAGRPGHWR